MTLTRALQLEPPGGGCGVIPTATRTVLGALVLTLPQLRSLMNYATVAASLLFSLSPSRRFHSHICLRREEAACTSPLFVWRARRRMGARLWRARKVAAVLWRRLTGYSEPHGPVPSCREAAALFTRPPATLTFFPPFVFPQLNLFSLLSASPSRLPLINTSSLSCIPPVLKAADGWECCLN